MSARRWLPIFCAAIALAGCARPPNDEPTIGSDPMDFRAEPGHAVVYVFRDERFGAGEPLAVSVDGGVRSALAAGTFVRRVLSPGVHRLVSHRGENRSLTVEAGAGELYFVRLTMAVGETGAHGMLTPVPASDGREAVRRCKPLTAIRKGSTSS